VRAKVLLLDLAASAARHFACFHIVARQSAPEVLLRDTLKWVLHIGEIVHILTAKTLSVLASEHVAGETTSMPLSLVDCAPALALLDFLHKVLKCLS